MNAIDVGNSGKLAKNLLKALPEFADKAADMATSPLASAISDDVDKIVAQFYDGIPQKVADGIVIKATRIKAYVQLSQARGLVSMANTALGGGQGGASGQLGAAHGHHSYP